MEFLGARSKEKGLYLHAIVYERVGGGGQDLVKPAAESWKQQKR